MDWFEAESGTVITPLEVMSDQLDASGGQYIGVIPGSGNSTSQPTNGVATYSLTIPADGVYKLALRVIAPDSDSDSCWIRISDMVTNTDNHSSGWIRFNGIEAGNSWHWDEVHSYDDGNLVVEFALTAGTHTLEIARREEGLLIDVIAVIGG